VKHGEYFGPVLRLDLKDTDRRLLRQVLNKLKGTHVPELDAAEFQRLIDADELTDLKRMLVLDQMDVERVLKHLEGAATILDKLAAAENQRNNPKEKIVREVPLAECPKCGFRFNPDNHLAVEMLEEAPGSLCAAIKEGSDKGLGKPNNVVLDLAFQTRQANVTKRAVAVAESFGIGIDESRKFEVFRHLELSYGDKDIIYITGDSGSGKTTFLRLIKTHEQERGRVVLDIEEVNPDPGEVVIDSIGASTDEAMGILSSVGLSEAFLMLRRYGDLSDGQKYRYRLAKTRAVGSIHDSSLNRTGKLDASPINLISRKVERGEATQIRLKTAWITEISQITALFRGGSMQRSIDSRKVRGVSVKPTSTPVIPIFYAKRLQPLLEGGGGDTHTRQGRGSLHLGLRRKKVPGWERGPPLRQHRIRRKRGQHLDKAADGRRQLRLQRLLRSRRRKGAERETRGLLTRYVEA